MLSPSLNNLNLRKEKRNKQIITTIIANYLTGNKEKNKFKLRKKKRQNFEVNVETSPFSFPLFSRQWNKGAIKVLPHYGKSGKEIKLMKTR